MRMVKLALRGIRASVGRLVLTLIAIVVGVGFVAGAFILADSLEETFDTLFENIVATIDAEITAVEPEFGEDNRTIPDTLTEEVRALPEVGEATPTVDMGDDTFRPFVVQDEDGNPVEPPGGPIISFSWNGEVDEDVLTLTQGEPPMGMDQMAIDSTYATRLGAEIGDVLTVTTPDGEDDIEVTAIIDLPITGGAYFVLFDFETAQVRYDKEGVVDAIDLSRAPGVSTEEMIAAVEQIIPEQADVLNQDELLEAETADFELVINVIRYGLLGFALVSLFVSLFIIYNTFAILVTQRLQQFGMLRAIGATRGQVRVIVLVEALIVGVTGSALGLAAGLGVAKLIQLAFQSSGFFPETGTVVALRTVIACVSVGIGATLISALIPAFFAGRISPIAAMRNEPPSRRSMTVRIALGATVLVIGLVLYGLGLLAGGQAVALLLTELFAGAILIFVGVAMLSVLFAGPAVDLIGKSPVLGLSLLLAGIALPILTFTVGSGVPGGFFGWVTFVPKMLVSAIAIVTGASITISALRSGTRFGVGGSAAGLEGRLARQNAARAPQRTAATATALTIGIALVSMVGVFGESLKSSFSETVDQAIRADLFVYDETGSTLPPNLADDVAAVDGVAAVSPFRFNEVRVDDEVVSIGAYNAATGETVVNFALSDGGTEGLLDGGVLVYRDVAEDKGLAIGDELTIEFPDESTEQVTVSGIFEENRVFQTPYMIDLDLYAQHVNTGDFFLGATVAEGADPDEVKTDVTAVAALTGSSIVQDTGEYQETVEGQVDGFVTLLNYLLAFALVVAFLGVVNTIVLSVVERTREIGLLRAVGMTRRQVRATIRWESVIVCLFGAVLGIVVGVLFATAAVSAIPDDYISNIAIPYESVLFAILVAAMAGVVAALLPARRAAKLNVLEAVASVGG